MPCQKKAPSANTAVNSVLMSMPSADTMVRFEAPGQPEEWVTFRGLDSGAGVVALATADVVHSIVRDG